MSTTCLNQCFDRLYKSENQLDHLSWNRFCDLGGFNSLSKSYLANRLDQLLRLSFVLPKPVVPQSLPTFANRLLFVDGIFQPDHSFVQGAHLLTLAEAQKTYPDFVESRWHAQTEKEKSPAALLNAAFARGGAFIYLPAEVLLEAPIHCVQLFSAASNCPLVNPRIHFFAGERSQAKLVMHYPEIEGPIWINQSLDCQLQEGAHLEVASCWKQASSAYLFDTFRATLKKQSLCQVTTISGGGRTVLRDAHFELVGPEAQARLYAATTLGRQQHEHFNVLMEHRAPHCISDQHIKHVGYAASQHSFEGKIYVHREAKETESFQKHQALLLDATAFSASKPNLEILTDEVKASHGATSGQLNQESIFYLMARGLSKEQAEALLIEAHLQEIIDYITIDSVQKEAALFTGG